MLCHPKKLLTAVARATAGGGDEQSTWRFNNETVAVGLPAAVIQQWKQWKQFGTLPERGGWKDQPLKTLVAIEAIDLVYRTATTLQDEKADWSEFSKTQVALISELEMA